MNLLWRGGTELVRRKMQKLVIPKRWISYQISPEAVQAIVTARKNSTIMEKIFSKIEKHETSQQAKLREKAIQFSKRATGPDGYLHPSYTVENILRVMKANMMKQHRELTIKQSPFRNAYDPQTHTVHLIDPKRPDMVIHEVKHALDRLKNPFFGKMSVVRKELSAFKAQARVAKQLGIRPNMPHASPKISARTYRKKDPKRFKD
ncbi:MAG: hypothetical protein ACJ8KA_01405 [Sulfurifustis sp.]